MSVLTDLLTYFLLLFVSGEADGGNTQLAGISSGSTLAVVFVFLFCFVLQIFARLRSYTSNCRRCQAYWTRNESPSVTNVVRFLLVVLEVFIRFSKIP